MVRDFRAPFRVRFWTTIRWYVKRIAPVLPEFFAGVCFGLVLFAILPIAAAFFA